MNFEFDIIVKASIVGVGGTVALDAWAAMLHYLLGTPATNWAMVGRWLAHMPGGKFHHEDMAAVAPVRGEAVIGWVFHYGIGIGYGLLLVAVTGVGWLHTPTIPPAVLLSLVLLVAPFFVMMPGLGLGLAGAKTPDPNLTRLKSVLGHTMFGLGMYATALALPA
ncbi:MAG: DUF2938 domain-containing protein [Pseudomonadota bacterium]